MKKLFALAFASLLAFASIASPPGKPKLGTLSENFELQAASCVVTVQDQTLIACEFALKAIHQDIELSILNPSSQVVFQNCTKDTGIISNFQISPFPAELEADLWRKVVNRFHYAYITYGYHSRSNSPPPNLG